MLIAILLIGFLFIGLALKVAKGILKIVLIVIIIAIMAASGTATHNDTAAPTVSTNT